MKLKYGMNPYQKDASIDLNDNLKVLNGNPSIINFLDGLNSWQLVKEIYNYVKRPTSTSFKHVTPSGVSTGNDLITNELNSYNYNKENNSKLTLSYLQARGSDRLASFGDFIALSNPVDIETASLIRSEVSDGIIAPGYDSEALNILQNKKKNNYVIFQINKDYNPILEESRTIYGFDIKQNRNNIEINDSLLSNVVTNNNNLNDNNKLSIIIGLITLKYTQSNSICVIHNGHVIGIGSGQQSRILCSELALNKANKWFQKTKLDYNKVDFNNGLKKTQKDQIIEKYRNSIFNNQILLSELDNLCLCSDGFFPHLDNIELAAKYGIKIIAAPLGSIKDSEIIEKCNELGITFINTKIRLFHH